MNYTDTIEASFYATDPETGCLVLKWFEFLVYYDITEPSYGDPTVSVTKIVDTDNNESVPFETIFYGDDRINFDCRVCYDTWVERVTARWLKEQAINDYFSRDDYEPIDR